MKNKVALVDDHRLFRRGMVELINGFLNFEVVQECDNGRDFIQYLEKEEAPDVALIDIKMPVMDGYETAQWIHDNKPSISVLAVSMYNDERSIIRMMKCGAKGYVLKDAEPEELECALEEIVHRGYYYSALVGEVMLHSLQVDPDATLDLNEREITFLQLACSELTYKEIAQKMYVSPRTIDGYRESLCQKLNLKNRIGLVMYAIEKGIYQF